MGLDDMKFDNDEDRRKYLADLARLKRIREEERLTKERLSSYIREEVLIISKIKNWKSLVFVVKMMNYIMTKKFIVMTTMMNTKNMNMYLEKRKLGE